MLHRTRTILLAALTLAAGHATAVPYTFQGPSYQQLQRTDTYETVCQSGSPCDVAPGTYTLLTFAGGPARRETVTIGESSEGGSSTPSAPAARISLVTNAGSGELSVASCPGDDRAVGGSCSAVASDGRILPTFGFTGNLLGEGINEHVCSTDEPAAQLNAEVTCIGG